MQYFCCDERRREAVKGFPGQNGIDFLEVLDDLALPISQRQRTLFVHFLNALTAGALKPENLCIEGGERIRDVAVTKIAVGTGALDHVLTVEVNHPGDFSIYTLRLVKSPTELEPPDGFDPMLSAVDFSFKVACPSDFDCRIERVCPPERSIEPAIDYLAKDYTSFRQLILDRMALLAPQWREQSAADLGVALVELLAYVGDYLSYQQDAVGTEAYLGTARRRVSVHRHARLVDYFMHDGCNARAWVQVQVNADILLPGSTQLLSRVGGQELHIPPKSPAYAQALAARPLVFETMCPFQLIAAHNELHFYTWGDRECCLPRGATVATLLGHYPALGQGTVLIFEEVLGPQTGGRENADPAHRHVVRLTQVMPTSDPVGGRFADPANNNPVDVTVIAWFAEDALRFPLCLSAITDAEHGSRSVPDVSLGRGNVVLADHGRTIDGERIKDGQNDRVPQPTLFLAPTPQGDRCQERPALPAPPRFRPCVSAAPLTQAARYDCKNPPASASAAVQWSLRDVVPAITKLESELDGQTVAWQV